MINPMVERDLRDQLEQLPTEQQRRVLDFARALVASQPRGVAGTSLLRFAGTLDVADAEQMIEAVNEGCEQVNPDAW